MIKYKLWDSEVFIDTKDPNEIALIQIEGGTFPDLIKERLDTCYDAFGHLMFSEGSPRDLSIAMSQEPMQLFKPKLIEGAEILDSDVFPEFPEGAVS